MSRRWILAIALIAALAAFSTQLVAQSLISGDVTGTVTDPSGAVVPNATVTLKSVDTGSSQTATTNQSGSYRFSLLKPGRYNVTVSQTGFQKVERPVTVALGQVATANVTLAVGQATQTVEVSAAAPLINPDASTSTSFSQSVVENVPNPGGDLSNIAQLAPGVTMNTSGGYGNFTANGLPATSNLFTINGENNMDPFFNINNTGATNLTLGQNEVQEATVITNPYGGQYGQQAGAQVNYVTKSGTNAYHGSAKYLWNGRVMNANDWFANNAGNERPFANNNQWGAEFGGPIKKDKLFFYVNNEGLRYVLPTVQNTYIASQALQDATMNWLATNDAAAIPTYTQMFNVWRSAPGAGRAVDVAGTCGGAIGVIPGITEETACESNFIATPTQLSTEWILSGRVDWNISNNDKAFVRYNMDRGLQATYTDPINSNFNATSSQPSYDGQLQWTHVFSGTTTNSFSSSIKWYTAIFKQNEDLANQTFGYDVTFNGLDFTNWARRRSFPQGRNVTQYQFIDDFSHIMGNHSLKAGLNFRRYDVSDFNFFYRYGAVMFTDPLEIITDAPYRYRQYFTNIGSGVPIALYGLGGYLQDEWKVSKDLKLTLALRLEHNSNPVCQSNCFALLNSSFSGIAMGGDVPYNSVLQTGLKQAFQGTDAVNVSPRFGFTWNPLHNDKTIISGGIGIFYDALPQGIVEGAFNNMPNVYQANIYNYLDPADIGGTISYHWANGAAGDAAVLSNAAQLAGFASGATYNSLRADTDGAFVRPSITNFNGTMHTPQYQEWNVQVQQAIGDTMALTLNYAGNHGINVPISNYPNAYSASIPGFPTVRPDTAFGTVTEYYSAAVANYNGLSATFAKRMSHGLSFNVNYTWSHAMDEISNGGAFVYGNDSQIGQLNPTCLRCNNYGNADYDIRHNMTASFVYQTPSMKGNKAMEYTLGGWTVSGSVFARTGLPYTIIDGNTAVTGYGNVSVPGQAIDTTVATFGQTGACSNGNSQCFDPSSFLTSYDTFPTQRRNQYRGPNLFDINLSLLKDFKLTERLTFGFGANFYNLFNHANFANPDWYLGDSTAGQIQSTVSAPASPYGSFVGAAAAPRLVQLQGKITF